MGVRQRVHVAALTQPWWFTENLVGIHRTWSPFGVSCQRTSEKGEKWFFFFTLIWWSLIRIDYSKPYQSLKNLNYFLDKYLPALDQFLKICFCVFFDKREEEDETDAASGKVDDDTSKIKFQPCFWHIVDASEIRLYNHLECINKIL